MRDFAFHRRMSLLALMALMAMLELPSLQLADLELGDPLRPVSGRRRSRARDEPVKRLCTGIPP
jgi:hypothetical protein